jgi:preprotein translocase subunit SecA
MSARASPADRGRWEWTPFDAGYQWYLNVTGMPIEYDVRPYLRELGRVAAIDVAGLPDEALHARAAAARQRVQAGEAVDAMLPEVFAIAREACARLLRLRPFDIQVAAGIALHRGRLTQLATGEGKTLVAVLPAVLNALAGNGVHILTANDYLARRDAGWMGPVYRFFGLDVAFVGEEMSPDERRRAYAADVSYVTAKEAGFDFLRDHTATSAADLVQRPYHYAIVDEADFILIDEARVPLVIAGPAPALGVDPPRLAALVRELRPRIDFDADEYARTIVLTETGFARAGDMLGVGLDSPSQHLLLSAVHVALHAHVLLKRDRDYIVRDGRVELVDEFTGRVAENRRWPHGIQPAVEAKEGVEVRPEGRILGAIPIQHFIRLYPRIAGMTATAAPSAEEFKTFFGLTTVVFPTNRPTVREDEPDEIFTHRDAKKRALLEEIASVHATGRPTLVGTASVRESEDVGAVLASRGIGCQILNARHDDIEAGIIARAGVPGAVTISTNMAGRGTDIVLGGGDPGLHAQVVALGGLYVIGTNRHESRRVDHQLRGRAGRQGDPGTSRFFISLEDDLIQRYGVMGLIPKSHRPARTNTPVDDPIVHREVARAQRIIEGENFEIRKTLWRYSQIVEDQRRIVYEWRQAELAGEDEEEICSVGAPRHYRALVKAAGAQAVRAAAGRITIHVLDRNWADHLALVEDVREGIHLQRYGGRQPIDEFHKQIVEAFDTMMQRVRRESVAAFKKVVARGERLDLEGAGVGGSTATWTYLVNDNPFSTLGMSLMANRNIGLAAGVGVWAVMAWPITLAASAAVLLGRWLKKRRGNRPV